MLTLSHLFWGAVFVFCISHWWRSRDAKAWALEHASRRCEQLGLQLLDQSIVLRKLRPAYSAEAGICWRRYYSFEFSATGGDRYPGEVELAGNRLTAIHIAPHVVEDAGGARH